MKDDVSIFNEFARQHYDLASCFTNIAIETCNFCNRGCDFCPVGHDRKPVQRMHDGLFLKILTDLSDFEYRGDICLQWYNEPLADKRLPDMVRMARAACPDSYIYCASNGDLLTPKLFDRLVRAGLNLINVSQYDGHIQANVQTVIDSGIAPERLCVGIKGADVLTNTRGGSITPLTVNEKPLLDGVRCIRPDEQLIVDAHGNVPLCCNDYHISHCVGNAADRGLLDLWGDIRLINARHWLRAGDRSRIEVCRACNEPDNRYANCLPKGNIR